MKKGKILAFATAIMMSVGTLGGCGLVDDSSDASVETKVEKVSEETVNVEDIKIGYAMNTTTNTWHAGLVSMAKKTAEEKGVELIVLDAAGKADKQQSDLEDLVAQGVDVIVVNVCNGDALKSAINNVAKQVPVIAVDSSVAGGTNVTSFITADNLAIGLSVGRAMAEAWNSSETPNAVIVSGAVGDREGEKRREGFVAGFLEYQYEVYGGGNINVLSQKYATNWDAQTGVNQLQDIMVQYPEGIDMFFCESDAMTVPAMDAIKAVGYEGMNIIGSVDGHRPLLEMIDEGEVTACGVNSASEMGRLSIEYAIQVASGQSVPANSYVNAFCITKDNVSEYLANGLEFQ